MQDQREEERIKEIYVMASQKYPKNPETEKNEKKLYEIIRKINGKILESGKNLCKSQYENLLQYASISIEGLDVKPNADERKMQESLEQFQICIEDENKEIIPRLQQIDNDMFNLTEELNGCLDKTFVNSKEKSDSEIEKRMFDCLRKFEDQNNNFSRKSFDSLNKFNI